MIDLILSNKIWYYLWLVAAGVVLVSFLTWCFKPEYFEACKDFNYFFFRFGFAVFAALYYGELAKKE